MNRRRTLAALGVLLFVGLALNVLPVRLPAWPHSVPYGVGLSLAGFIVGYALDSLRLHLDDRRGPAS